jgi:hypothetical protein
VSKPTKLIYVSALDDGDPALLIKRHLAPTVAGKSFA